MVRTDSESERSRNDAFAALLDRNLAPYHSYKGQPPVRKRHHVSLMMRRELGRDEAEPSDENLQRSLLHSTDRYFAPTCPYRFRGQVQYYNNWVYAMHDRRVVNLEDFSDFHLPPLRSNTERVVKVMFIPPLRVEPPFKPIHYLVLLTDFSRLWFFDLEARVLVYTYQLPGHLFSFRELSVNKTSHEFYVSGKRRKPEDHIGKFDYYPAVVMFEIKNNGEIAMKYAFALETKFFGYMDTLSIVEDLLICYCKKPDRVEIYNLDKLYADTCMNQEMPAGYRDGSVTVGFNLNITETPKKLMEISGTFKSVHFCRNFMLLEPSATGARMKIISLCDISKKAILNGVNLPMSQEAEKSCEFMLDGFYAMHGDSDSDARILVFEGIHLVSYDVQSIPGTSEIQLTEGWRTALNLPTAPPPNPDEPRRSRSGRIVKPTVGKTAEQEENAKITNMVQDGGLILVAVIYNKATYSFYTDYLKKNRTFDPQIQQAERDECPAFSPSSVVFILDSMTGQITSLATVDISFRTVTGGSIVFTPEFSHTVTLEDDSLVVVTTDKMQSTVVMYRLTAVTAAMEEQAESTKYKSNALNRRQRRRLRQGRPPGGAQQATEADPSTSDPTYEP